MTVDRDWLADLVRRIDAPPERPRVPLELAGEGATATIGTVESDLALALAGAELPIVDTGTAWRIEAGADSADPVLERIAETLRRQSRAGAWRGELLAVTDDRGRGVGRIERAAVRPLGITTDAVHLIVHRPDGGVWVQQRAFDKSTDPGRWDTTMGGLIAAGESLAEALERETWEEAGLRPGALRRLRRFGGFTVRRSVPHGYMVERTELFEAVVDPTAVPSNQDGEVERFDCLAPGELVSRLHGGAFTLEAALALATWLAFREVSPGA